MKVLIISLPRTGSTSLMKKISESKGLKQFPEPFGIYAKKNNIKYDFEDDSIVKTIIGQKSVEFYIEYSNNFDEVILLSRKDLIACSESLAYMNWNIPKGYKHDLPYFWEYTPNYPKTKKWVFNAYEDLKKISQEIDIPIQYYEDLFDMNSYERQRKKPIKIII